VSRETKFGLLVGLAFIVLFGVILSGRVNSATAEHAALPTGESQAHAARAKSMHGTVDPFLQEGALDVGTTGAPGVMPKEEALPAPGVLVADLPPAPVVDDRVTLGFGPALIETPVGGDRPDAKLNRFEVSPDRPVTPKPGVVQPPDPSRPVYTVRSGDTLSSIAKQFYGKDTPKYWQQILEANKTSIKDPKRLPVGQKLVIPNVSTAAPATEAPKTDAPRTDPRSAPPSIDAAPDWAVASGKTYTIQAGDTFNKIAARVYGDSAKYGRLLAQKNPTIDPARLQIGQRIVLLDDAMPTGSDVVVAKK
jgi:nucleoid-associated protein YgaU